MWPCWVEKRNCRILHGATPDFLLNLVGSISFMRLSLRKAAHAVLSTTAQQEIRVRYGRKSLPSGAKPRMAASWAVIWDSVCDFLHGKSQALSEGSAVKPAIRGSPTYYQSFTARLKSCPDTKQCFSAACKAVPFSLFSCNWLRPSNTPVDRSEGISRVQNQKRIRTQRGDFPWDGWVLESCSMPALRMGRWPQGSSPPLRPPEAASSSQAVATAAGAL
jgi:hypothetical protein